MEETIVVVDATVNGVSMFRNKMRISLGIPAFGSDYDTNCTDFPDGMDQEAKAGDTYRLELRRQSLVKRQGGGTGDGTKPFHYYWGINGRTEEPLTVFARPQDGPTPQPQVNGLRNDPTGISIERQTALKGVVEIYRAKLQSGLIAGDDLITLWDDLFRDAERAAAWIHGGVADTVPVAAPVGHPSTPEPETEAPTHDQIQQEAFDNLGRRDEPEIGIGNVGDFLTQAQRAGHGYSSEILKKLGVEKPVDILGKHRTFDLAMAALKVGK